MQFRPLLMLALPALLPTAALAQDNATHAPASGQIIVEGRNARKSEPLSSWNVAETAHVLVYSNGYREDLARAAHNLEKLHFLLSVLLNRVDAPEDVGKLKVMLVGSTADYDHLELRNLRWQQGPFAAMFPDERYYDPRADGAFLATPTTDQRVSLHRRRDLTNVEELTFRKVSGAEHHFVFNIEEGDHPISREGFAVTAEGNLYSGYAQHYLMTYFPAAYPRWYLDGFGAIFSTLFSRTDDMIEYGRAPEGFHMVMDWYGSYPVTKLLDGSYLAAEKGRRSWTPFHAWALTHMLFFSDQWREPLHNYLAAVASGAPPEQAAAALGDPARLQAALSSYRGRKIPFERMTFPSNRAAAPVVRQLTRREATMIQAELVFDSRIELPPTPSPDTDAETAKRMTAALEDARSARDRWLSEIRGNATQYPRDIEAQLLLAEAECRVDRTDACLAASEAALALSPADVDALTWAGVAHMRKAIGGPAAEREAGLAAARALFVRANHADPEASLPLLAYYRSYADAGETAPEIAVNGLIKVTESEPAAPGPRLLLGEELARRGATEAAVRTLLPIANGAYDSPEKPKAQALVASLSKQ